MIQYDLNVKMYNYTGAVNIFCINISNSQRDLFMDLLMSFHAAFSIKLHITNQAFK